MNSINPINLLTETSVATVTVTDFSDIEDFKRQITIAGIVKIIAVIII
ncbi:MAG: hypothetical protein AB1393_11040 [Candidatus Edwardsbacteria bacterium]